MEHKILIVDDDTTLALMLSTWLRKKGYATVSAGTLAAAQKLLAAGDIALLLTDMRLPDGDGIDLLQRMRESSTAIPAIVMTGYADIQNAVVCIKLGASDYVPKPLNPDLLLRKIEEALSAPAAKSSPRAAAANDEPEFIEGRSDASRRLYEYVDLVAPTNMSTLIVGESGTGKEHIARAIHARSRRASGPFVAVDCGTIPRELAASEFFGHVKGSFTGALSDKQGAFAAADGGTLFLDEIGNLGYEIQIQLLRAIQERTIKPVGSNRQTAVDVRLVAATNENLESAIAEGRFRNDLYHRLTEFVVRMPSLRQQRDDIMLSADVFLDRAIRELDRAIAGFAARAAAALLDYDWPCNLRQLKNAVMR
ncbi:MAG: sigma-54 dependent transcriptional regulator, partial [Alistipes sp.]|nr:sigma-54 dependent transcriptional regulator [Alistipes sp.]